MPAKKRTKSPSDYLKKLMSVFEKNIDNAFEAPGNSTQETRFINDARNKEHEILV